MTVTESSVPTPSDGLLRAVEERYGLAVSVHRRLEGGYANDVFLVESPRGLLVLRRAHSPTDRESIAWEHALVARLAREVRQVPVPLPALDGSTFFTFHGDAVWLVPAIDGRPADRGDERHRVEAARLLGRLHRAASALDVQPRPGIDGLAQLRRLGVDGLPASLRDGVRRCRREALALLDDAAAQRPRTGMVHGDYFPGNVLVREGAAVGLVDWEEAHVGWPAADLANGAWEFCRHPSGVDLDREAAARFGSAYREAGGPFAGDVDRLLVPLIRVRRVLEVLRAPTDRHVDWEYQRRNLEAFDRLG